MINKFFILSLLVMGSMQAGKKTANALYWATTGTCYTGAAVATIPVVALASTVGLPVAAAIAPVATAKTALVTGAVVVGTESLAMKAYNFGMKL